MRIGTKQEQRGGVGLKVAKYSKKLERVLLSLWPMDPERVLLSLYLTHGPWKSSIIPLTHGPCGGHIKCAMYIFIYTGTQITFNLVMMYGVTVMNMDWCLINNSAAFSYTHLKSIPDAEPRDLAQHATEWLLLDVRNTLTSLTENKRSTTRNKDFDSQEWEDSIFKLRLKLINVI